MADLSATYTMSTDPTEAELLFIIALGSLLRLFTVANISDITF